MSVPLTMRFIVQRVTSRVFLIKHERERERKKQARLQIKSAAAAATAAAFGSEGDNFYLCSIETRSAE